MPRINRITRNFITLFVPFVYSCHSVRQG